MYNQTPSAPPPARVPTKASRFAWLPVFVGASGVVFGAMTGGLAWLAAPASLAVGGGGGFWLWRKHKEQRAEQQEKRLEQVALMTYRQHKGATMTKEQLVRDHRLHPAEADGVLNWLVTHDLLTADWDNYDGPIVYQRSDAAAGLPVPEPVKNEPRSRRRARGGRVVVHHHHAPGTPPGFVPEYKSPGLAMVLSMFWPGVGQMYAGNVGRGLAWMFGTWIGYGMLVIPGLIAHGMNIFNAKKTAEETNLYIHQYGTLPPEGGPPGALPGPPPPAPPRHRPPGL